VPDGLGLDGRQTRFSAQLQANVNEFWSGINQSAVEIKQHCGYSA
jgi:hypothetical protein